MVRDKLVELIAASCTYDTEYVNGGNERAEVVFIEIDNVDVSIKEEKSIAFNCNCQLITKSTMTSDLIGQATLILLAVERLIDGDEKQHVKVTSKRERVVRTTTGIETALSFEYYLLVDYDRTQELIKQINWE